MSQILHKYLIPFLLITAIQLPSLLNVALFLQQKHQVRREVKAIFKEGIKPSDLQKIVLSAREYVQLDWEKPSEFLLRGHKYDVYDVDIDQGFAHLSVWEDHKESALEQKFHSLLAQHQPEPTSNDNALSKIFKDFFFQQILVFGAYAKATLSRAKGYTYYLRPLLGIDSPPPDSVSRYYFIYK
jgi:hypothetical protein